MEAVCKSLPQIALGSDRTAIPVSSQNAPIGLYNGLKKASSRTRSAKRVAKASSAKRALHVAATAAVETPVKADMSVADKVGATR